MLYERGIFAFVNAPRFCRIYIQMRVKLIPYSHRSYASLQCRLCGELRCKIEFSKAPNRDPILEEEQMAR